MSFAFPWLIAIALAAPVVVWLAARRDRSTWAAYTPIGSASVPRGWRARLAWAPIVLRGVCLVLLALAIARPREPAGPIRTPRESVAIQLVVDRSGSMNDPMDYQGQSLPRLEVVKRVLKDFVVGDGHDLPGREGDLLGLIAFARYAETVCPLVHAHDVLMQLAEPIKPADNRLEDGTAIGDAMALGAARLKRAEEDLARRDPSAPDALKSKVMIVLTDGANNAGSTGPVEAARLAAQWGIRVHLIGIGAGARTAVIQTPFGEQRIPVGGGADEEELREAARIAGGRYWRAGDADSLRQIQAEIDRMERTRIAAPARVEYRELFAPLAMLAGLALIGELVASSTVLRRAA